MKKNIFAILFLFVVTALVTTAMLSFNTASKHSYGKRTYANPNGRISIIVDKSDYELHIYDDEGWYATYPVVFGNKSLDDKMMEGDRNTPEGEFKVIAKRPHNKWNKILLLDYPTRQSWEKFNRRKTEGLIPKSAKIGGDIGIHGTWAHDKLVVDDFTNWTQGCVALRNEDLDDIYRFVEIGTKVTIRK